ncbi:hypothetical protein A0H81_02215 [Grifola frondosa]|uniref:Uncharacterized protein n=1 Tax=Grifola frondosa TaxID=5627 RepID=A0A1C7MMD8_GRIFR|nr:hypothetical protein A0H81_02215 [Grifola frondosa]
MSEFIEVRYVKARVQKDQAARHRHEEQPSTTHTPAPPPSVTTTYSSTFDLLGRWLGEDHGTGFGDITDISSLTDSMAKITSSSPHTTYEQLDPLPSKRIREVNGSDDEDPDDHYGTSPKKQRYAERSPTPFLAPKSRSKAAGKVPQCHIASSTGTSRHMPGSYPKSVESAPRPSLRKTYAVSYNSSDHNLYPDLTQFMGSVPTTSAPDSNLALNPLLCREQREADPEPAKGNQLGVGQQDIQELGHHIARFTDALLAFTAQQSRFPMHSTLQPATAQ